MTIQRSGAVQRSGAKFEPKGVRRRAGVSSARARAERRLGEFATAAA
jgi:hypothetical protein